MTPSPHHPGVRRIETTSSWAEAAAALRSDPSFRAQLVEQISSCPFEAVFWETCSVSRATRDRPFAYVVADAPLLARVRPEPGPFAHALTASVTRFENLGGDAWLIAPRQEADPACYTSLAPFLRGAPAEQVDLFWRRVGEAVEAWWAERARPVWVSTSGLGVHWLHVRLDSRPKYYTYAPFRARP